MSEPFELALTEIVYGGSAFGRHEGRAVFVPYAIAGERVAARVVKDQGRFALAEAESILDAAPSRVTPRCPHFGLGKCGGCHWQHMDYPAQLGFKTQIVRDQLARFGGLPDALVRPTLASPSPWNYRAHVTFHVTPDGKLGFVATDDETPLPIAECHIIRPELVDLFDQIRAADFSGFERVRLQVGSAPEDRLIALTPRELKPPSIKLDVQASVCILWPDSSVSTVNGGESVCYSIGGKRFRVTAGSFFQVNLPQAENLVSLALERLALQGVERVLDLYSGVGLFTAFLAERALHVTAIESYAPAVHDAAYNLKAYENVELVTGTIEGTLPRLKGKAEAVLVDPPRGGMHPRALDALIRRATRRLVYVSCDPSTLARDAKRLTQSGYRLVDAQPVDMFPQTHHIETVATFTRR